jgi:serine/alanine adding enzyme
MNVHIEALTPEKVSSWDEYVSRHPRGTLYHLSNWRDVIQETYGHRPCYLMAVRIASSLPTNGSRQETPESVAGILPLVSMKHFLFGNRLVSIPFFDLGGIIADDLETEKALLNEAAKLGKDLRAGQVELRNIFPLEAIEKEIRWQEITLTRSHKVRMLLELPKSPEILMKSLKSKLRSQIRLPIKEGLTSKIGGLELLDEFYEVFTVNMRDLGSPVHSRKIMKSVLEKFTPKSRIVIVSKENRPLAGSLVVGFKDTLENPWASALREYSRLGPNMLLYWTMLEYACSQGYRFFDFGRSTPDEGTYHFKEQWGATPQPLNWQYITLNGKPVDADQSEKSKFDRAIEYWKKLPVPVTRVLGPLIRKHISL